MREILLDLFKGKRIDNGEWVYGYYFYDKYYHKAYITLGNNVLKVSEENPNKRILEAFEVIPETVGRETGFKDKNGKKIFEGDILSFKNDDGEFSNYEVVYFGNRWGVIQNGSQFADELDIFFCERSAVIGNIHDNIHDNPELLKES